ncbi:hypothetical protein TMES_08625 [Thalassospira mesophila]|uniref:Uncharacterized protein n=1 Tax=Thalassospira mesophila TaxID=1293891 RepID=A0A1Y2L0S6_9PROT|nr:hypothetical protein TMES_08625 [Thalassospira mesophila]
MPLRKTPCHFFCVGPGFTEPLNSHPPARPPQHRHGIAPSGFVGTSARGYISYPHIKARAGTA